MDIETAIDAGVIGFIVEFIGLLPFVRILLYSRGIFYSYAGSCKFPSWFFCNILFFLLL